MRADPRSAFCGRGWLWASLALLLALGLPSLGAGLFSDDAEHAAALRGLPAPGVAPLDLFASPRTPADVARLTRQGLYPWWTLPELRLAFFRPLSSLLAAADHTLFGERAAPAHLHSIAWALLLALAAAALLRRALPSLWGAALLLYAIDPGHAVAVAWLANRNALIASAAALFGLCAHVRWREERWRPGLPLSLLGLSLGLLAGEAALGAVGYWCAFELCAGAGRPAERARALLPASALIAAYSVHYFVVGYGAVGSGVYLDPIRSPLAWLSAAPERALASSGGAVLALPADAWALGGAARAALALGGAVALLALWRALAWAWPRLPERDAAGLRWLLPGALLSLLPGLSTFPASRLLVLPTLGVDAALACALVASLRAGARLGRWPRALAGTFAVAHLLVPLLAWPIAALSLRRLSARAAYAAASAPIDDARAASQRVIVLVAPDSSIGYHLPTLRALQGRPRPARTSVLSMARADHRFTRTAPAALEMELVQGEMMGELFEQLVRDSAHPLLLNQQIEVAGLRATILELGQRGPRRVRFELDAPLEDAQLLWWRSGRLQRIAPPAIGHSIDWRWEAGPLPL